MSEPADGRYSAYLNSEQWRALRDAVICRAYYRCEVGNCPRPAAEVHHLTYERLYREKLTDLVAICRECHDSLTDPNSRLAVRCLTGQSPDCDCPVCDYRRSSKSVLGRMRDKLTKSVNRALHKTNLRLYGRTETVVSRYAGVAKRLLPPSLLCKRTGEPAGLDETCPCEACRWMRLAEKDFRRNEREEVPSDGGKL